MLVISLLDTARICQRSCRFPFTELCLKMAIFKMSLALLLLACQSFASPTSAPGTALVKRDQCAIYAPGEFKVQGADAYFLSCPGGINFALQASDGNFVV